MRVAYVFDNADIMGSADISLVELIEEIKINGVEPVAFVPGPGEVRNHLESLGVEVRESSMPPVRWYSILALSGRQKDLAVLFKKTSVDLVHSNGAKSLEYAGPAAAILNIPSVWHHRDFSKNTSRDKWRCAYSDAVIASSLRLSKSVEKFMPSRHEVELLHDGIKVEKFVSATAIDLKKEFNVSDGKIALVVGRVTPRKHYGDFLEACSRAVREGIDVVPLLVGGVTAEDMEYKEQLMRKAEKLGLPAVFCGWRDDIASIMKASDLLVMSSFQEPFGRVIVEAMASSLPVIATHWGGPEEIISHETNGLLVENGNYIKMGESIISVLGNPDFADKLRRHGLERARDFNIQNHARKVLDVYKDLKNEF